MVFDLGGVLIDGDFRYPYRKLVPSEAEVDTFLATICTLEWHERHDRCLPVTKPDRAIFDLLCEGFGLTPRRTVFVDDSPRNVDAADQLGFRALRFTSPDQLRADLAALGALDEPAIPP